MPNKLSLNTNDYLHIQWTGSNTHNNGGNSDGQAGDAGQGQTGTDRNNLVQINNLNENYPIPYEVATMWSEMDLIGFLNEADLDDDSSKYLKLKSLLNSNDIAKDLALYFSTSAYYQCVRKTSCGAKSYEILSAQAQLNADLNNAPASVSGALVKFNKSNRVYYFMCSRNNNFSNRSQKGAIHVVN